MREIRFTTLAFEQYNDWQIENKPTYNRLTKWIKETAQSPFTGAGKPEALKIIWQVIGLVELQRNTGWYMK